MTTKDEIRRFIELVSEKTAFDENCLNQPRSAHPVYSVSLGGASGILVWILLFPEHKIPYSLQRHVNNL